MTILKTRFDRYLKTLKNRGPTSQLWVQYFDMVTIIKNFVMVEQVEDWKLHLKSVQKMIPYFHVCGHFPYAKASHLYLQDMYNLELKMETEEFQKLTSG